jgi:glycosyltransferase involved in cell wall biosynthesis
VPLRVLAPDESLSRSRAAPAVCIVLTDQDDGAVETLLAIVNHTSAQVPILLVGAAGGSLEDLGGALSGRVGEEREIFALAVASGAGFSSAVNAASAVIGSGDIVLLAPGVRVGPSWLERLTHAAHCDSTVVSATAFNDGGGPLGVPVASSHTGRAPLGQPDAAVAVISRSPRAYPRIASAGPDCVYLRRELFDRLGALNPAISNPAEALAEVSLRALALGMLHVAADDVFVTCATDHQPAGAELPASEPADERTVLRRSLGCARSALQGVSVTIDARALGPGLGGTQLYTAELILALASDERLRVRAVVPPDLPEAMAHRFEGTPALEILTYEQAAAGVELSDVVHRPQQVFSEDDLALLPMLGERVVIGQQDLIAYRNPAYHQTVDHWQRYRRVTRLALAVADRVVFFSEHAKRDAVSEDLVTAERGDVGGIGADVLSLAPVSPVAPDRAERVPGERDLLVCIGADYKHKNRPFAIALLHALRERHGWQGALVLAGSHVPYGSSREEEASLLEHQPGLTASVIDVGPVSEAEKAWLYQRARAVVYPTLYEGFGLIPFEAARAGTPCLFAPQASLLELAGPDAATLIPWDARLSSDAAAALLREGPEREHHLSLLADRMASSRWADVVGRLLETYEQAIQAPYRTAAPRAWQELQRETLITTLANNAEANNRAYNDLRDSVGVGLPLVVEGGLLSRDEQRGLMRVASRPPLHRLILSPFGALGRLRVARAPVTPEPGSEGCGDAQAGEQVASDDAGMRW